MKKLRELHLYLGCVFAPVLIFFAVTGAWQLFMLHRGTKNGSYMPPRSMVLLSGIHQVQHLPSASPDSTTPLRYFMLAAALGLVTTTALGVIMAFRYGRSRAWVAVCLIAGVVIPFTLLVLYR